MPSIIKLTTVTNLVVSTLLYDAVFTCPLGWTVGHKPSGLYDIYNASNQLVMSDTPVPFTAGMGRDPRDCLGYLPNAGTPPPALLSSSEAIMKAKSDQNIIKSKAVKKAGFVVTAGGWIVNFNSDGTFIKTDMVSGSTPVIGGTPHTPDGDGWHVRCFPPKDGFHAP